MTDDGEIDTSAPESAAQPEGAGPREPTTAGGKELKQAYDQGRQDYRNGASYRANPFAPNGPPHFLDPPPDRRQLLKARLWLTGFHKERDAGR